jgi:hypothetical protein
MDLSLDDYKIKLISKIHSAASQDEVKRFIDTGIKSLRSNKVNSHNIDRFIDKAINELHASSPLLSDAQQWSNIKMARVLLYRVKCQLNTPGNKP